MQMSQYPSSDWTGSSPTGVFDESSAIGVFEQSSPTGVFEPPRNFAFAGIWRNKLLVCVIALAAALLAGLYAHSRARTYTTSATLQVGQVNPNSPGFYSYIQSSAALATAFSRAIDAEPVLAAIQHKLGLAPATAAGRLSAEPLPLSPAFRIFATGPSEAAATQLANVTAAAVIAYVGQSNSANPEAESLLAEYHKASLQLQRASSNLEHVTLVDHGLRKTSRAAYVSAVAPAKAAVETAAAKLAAIRVAYTATVTSQAPRSGLVSLIAGATSAGSDRRSKVELFAFIGLLAGFVIGCAAAVAREHRRAQLPAPASAGAAAAEAPHSVPA
jgi:Chain length determinant protein